MSNNTYEYIDIGKLFEEFNESIKEDKREEEKQKQLQEQFLEEKIKAKLTEFVIPTDGVVEHPTKPNRLIKQAVLIDGSSFAYKYYFGSELKIHPTLKKNVNMVELMLKKILAHLSGKPDYLFVVWEGGKNIRHEIYPQYKANRAKKEENYKWQLQTLNSILNTIGIPTVFVEKWEADDVIYSLAKDLTEKHKDINIYIHTRDKDFFQLCADNIFICRDKDNVYDKKKFEDTHKYPVEKFVNFLAMSWDAADNIPSVIPKRLWKTSITKLFWAWIYSPEEILEKQDFIREQKLVKGLDFIIEEIKTDAFKERWKLNLSLVQMYRMPETKKMIEKELFDTDWMLKNFTYKKTTDTLIQAFQFDKLLPFVQWIFKT